MRFEGKSERTEANDVIGPTSPTPRPCARSPRLDCCVDCAGLVIAPTSLKYQPSCLSFYHHHDSPHCHPTSDDLDQSSRNMWSKLAVLSALVFSASANLHGSRGQTPFSFGSALHGHATSASTKSHQGPGYGTPSLGEAFTRFASSEVDASALKAFAPSITSFDALSEEQYTTLSHPAYPRHGVRVKKSSFCDGTVE
jgi:hypothetical protein